ncbi:MAG: helix-turn-helix domain-containing protein [Christensenella sp.]
MDISKLILNPARLRILQYLSLHEKVRTSELVEVLGDIPRATIYHHVKILEDNELIELVEENRVRGTIEKVYSLKSRQMVPEGESVAPLSAAFHLGLMHELDRYFSCVDSDYKKDRVFFTSALLRITDAEYDTLMDHMADLMKPYIDRKYEEGQRLRKLSLISAPPKEENHAL